MFSFVIFGGIAATTLKFINNAKTQQSGSYAFEYETDPNFTLSLENKTEVGMNEFLLPVHKNKDALN